jgi:hypothetical protein
MNATIDIGAASAATPVPRFDTKPVMEAPSLNEELLW